MTSAPSPPSVVKTAIVTDSAASLPPGAADSPIVAPMQLILDGQQLRDGLDITAVEFYRALPSLAQPPTTAAPSPQSYLDAFQQAAQDADAILCITVSPAFSASYDSAQAAIRAARQAMPDIHIEVLDSGSAAGGEGLVATAAQRAARAGASLQDVRAAAARAAEETTLLAFLDTLYYVWKGGRVPRIAYAGAALLGIKPMLEMTHGSVRNVARPRTRRRATDRMLKLMDQRAADRPVHVSVMHGDALEEAERLQANIESRFDCRELFLADLSPVIGAHTGPGLLAIAFWPERPG